MLFGCVNKVRCMNSLVKCIKYFSVFGIVFLFFVESVFAQSEKVFTISEFVQDPFDLSGRGENTKRVDGSGHLYAIVKVSSDDPEDKLTDYRFDFGMLNSKMEMVDGELWVYVQKNAKQVTGYSSIVNLSYTVKTGHDYLGLDYIGGYRFNNKNFLGIGAGIRYAFAAEALTMTDLNVGASLPGNSYVVPVFLYYRYNFLNGRFSPFLGLSAGANLSTRAVLHLELCDVKYTTIGGFLDPQVGINYRITPKSSLYLSVGFNLYTMSKCIDNTGYSATFKHSLYYGADIHMGFTF